MSIRPTRRSGSAAGAAAVLVGLSLLVACGGDRESNATPGYTSTPRTVDTSPFTPAGASSEGGPTTIPDAFFDPETNPTTTLPPTTTIATTTTTGVGPLVPPEIASIDDLCGFEKTVAPYEKLPEKTPGEVEPLMRDLVLASSRYAVVAPSEFRADARSLAAKFVEIRDLLANNGWNARSEAYAGMVQRFRAEATDRVPGSFPVLLGAVVAAERVTCG